MSETLQVFPSYVPYVILFLFGLLWGSFANVVILRLPNGESFIKPRSRCPQCKAQIAGYDNIPVVSWLILGGKCRNCKAPISFRYPFVELLTGGLFSAAYYFVGPNPYLFEILLFLFSLVCCVFIDIDHYILPDKFTLSGIVIGFVCAILNPIENRDWIDSLLGILLGGGFLWALAFFYAVVRKEEGMGGGDIKLLAWIGAVLGWKAVPFVIVVSSIIGSIAGILIAVRSKNGMKTVIPFGPYLALGAVIFIFGGQQLAHWYLSLFIPELGQ